jgi:hypothetical protein
VSSVRFERTHGHVLNVTPLPLGYEDLEPLSGADPDRLPYGGRIAAARNGVAAAPGASMTRRTKAGGSGAAPSAAQDGCDLPCSR